MMNQWGGILPAVVTPFDSDGKFSPRSFEQLLERLYAAGSHGIYVCGQTGEGLLQSVSQRKSVAELAVRCSPAGKAVIVHVGSDRSVEAVELAKHAARTGATAVSSLPPIGAYAFTEIKAYYETLAKASDLPLVVYFFPEVCPSITTVDQIAELCSIPGVIGLKFTDFDLFKLSVLKQRGALIFNGRDEVLVAGLLMGADGGIGTFYNLVPELFLEVYELASRSQWDQARVVQKRINELIEITLHFPPFPAVKTMLYWSGIDCGQCLPPRRALTKEEELNLQNALAKSSFAEAPFSALAVR